MCRCFTFQTNDIKPNRCVRDNCTRQGMQELSYKIFGRTEEMLKKGGYMYCKYGQCCKDIQDYENNNKIL